MSAHTHTHTKTHFIPDCSQVEDLAMTFCRSFLSPSPGYITPREQSSLAFLQTTHQGKNTFINDANSFLHARDVLSVTGDGICRGWKPSRSLVYLSASHYWTANKETARRCSLSIHTVNISHEDKNHKKPLRAEKKREIKVTRERMPVWGGECERECVTPVKTHFLWI